jgi:hypothetical protein
MNKVLLTAMLAGASAVASVAFAADEMARVISATPVTQQVGVPRQACATYAAPGVAPQCSTQTIYESRTVAYNVIYEYAGKQYSVQMPQNPGATIRLQVGGVQVAGAPAPTASPAGTPNVVIDDPAMQTAPSSSTTYVAVPYPAPVQVTYGAPGYVSYYGSPYYATWGPVLSLGFVGGYYGAGRYYGGYGGRGGHGHRR